MDSPWKYSQYSPSSACEISPPIPLDPIQFATESDEVIRLTNLLKSLPFDPETWLNRGYSLRLLGYPELALGDVYKARLLVEAGLLEDAKSGPSSENGILGREVRRAFRKKTYDQHTKDPAWIRWADTVSTPELLAAKVKELLQRLELQIWTELMEGLMAANCCVDYGRLSREAVEKFPDDEFLPSEVRNADAWNLQRETILDKSVEKGELSKEKKAAMLSNGGVYPTPYPFMTEDFLTRDASVFSGIEEDFKRVSTNCMVIRSAIRDITNADNTTTTEDDCIGAIATRDILAGETILVDAPSFGSIGVDADPSGCPTCCASPVLNFFNTCCSVLYCSQTCADVALTTFHPPICEADFEYLHAAAREATFTTDFALDALLLQRVLALAISSPASHPLKSQLLVRLTPAYNFQTPNLIIFNFQDHIIAPITILSTLLGPLAPFTAPAYDTWVLHTIKCRLQNNKHGQTLGDWPGTAISGLYSMLNHSCAPNVDWRHEGRSSEVTMFATRDCKKGEELCISYIGVGEKGKGPDVEGGVVARRRRLMGWFGMDCACARCVEESAALGEEGRVVSQGIDFEKESDGVESLSII